MAFISLSIKFHLPEDSAVGSLVYNFTAVDPEGHSIIFSSSDLSPLFSLSKNGELRLNATIDHEDTSSELSFTLTGSDGSGSSQVGVVISITDVNDNSPVFNKNSYQGSLPENQPPGTTIIQVGATDSDSGSNGAITYSLVKRAGDDEALLYLGVSPQGGVFSQYTIDYERIQSLSVTVRASDNGSPPQHTDVPLTVIVENVPEKAPMFIEPSYSVSINKATPTDSSLLRVQAIAEDNVTSIRYRLKDDLDMFEIDKESGVIFNNADISSFNETTYELEVTAMNNDISTSVPVFISIASAIESVSVYPRTFYVSNFPYLLPDEISLGRLTVPGLPFQYSLSLVPSFHEFEDYFTLLQGDELTMSSFAPARIHTLNLSISSGNQNWFDQIEVHFNHLSNSSLANHISLLLPNLKLNSLGSHILSNLFKAVASQISCSVNRLQLVSIQGTDRGTELVITVLKPDLVSYVDKEDLLYRLIENIDSISEDAQWTVLIPDTELCFESYCSNFQQCVASVTLFTPWPQQTLATEQSLSVLSLPFSLSPSCLCPKGFSDSNNCAEEINECSSNPCLFGAKCVDLVDGYECECPLYTSGKNCSVVCPSASCELCSPNPCLKGGDCTVQNTGDRLCSECPNGRIGPLCELTTAHFQGSGYVEIPSPAIKSSLNVTFSFSTFSPNSVLMYTGKPHLLFTYTITSHTYLLHISLKPHPLVTYIIASHTYLLHISLRHTYLLHIIIASHTCLFFSIFLLSDFFLSTACTCTRV